MIKLSLTSKLDSKTIADLGLVKEDNELIFFVDYSDSDIPLNTIFGDIELIQITQQFKEEWNSIHSGWKTICKFKFKNGIPEKFNKLKETSAWDFNDDPIIISSI